MDDLTTSNAEEPAVSNVQEPSWQRTLLIGLVALVAVAAIIGGIVAILAVKAADVTLNNGSGPDTPGQILPTTSSPTPTPPSSSSPSGPTQSTTSSQQPQRHGLTLHASPHRVGSMGRINLVGQYPGHDGASLQIQRSYKGGAWTDFPVSVTVHGDHFATYVETGYSGPNKFRVVDKATGQTSNSVFIVVG